MQNIIKKFVSQVIYNRAFETGYEDTEETEDMEEPEDIDKIVGFIDTGYLPNYSHNND